MVQNKFENQIKEKLEAREIQPSANSWDRLDAMLSVAEEKKTKCFPFFSFQSIGIAASILVLLSLGLYFFNQKESISKPEIEVVVKEDLNEKNNDKNNINDNIKNNNEILVQQNNQVAETTNNKQQTINNKSSKSFNPINQKTINQNPIVNQEKAIEFATTEVIAQKETPKIIYQEKAEVSKKVSVNANDLLASDENESKLANATKKSKIKVDSNSLLSQVDGELEQTFRQKVINRISKNYQEVKVALANRNQQ